MRKTIYLITILTLLAVWSCNSGEEKRKEELKEEIRAELKAELEQKNNSETQSDASHKENRAENETESAIKTITAKFEMMVANTAGTYYVFTDENGNRLDLFPTRETQGLDFARSLQPGDTGHKYYGKQYKVTYVERRVEIKDEMINRLFILEAEPQTTSGKTNDDSGKKAAFTANEIKNAVFMGTEPFWDIKFYDSYAEKNDPSGTKVKFYYLKNGKRGNYRLSDVIEPASSNSITLAITDESGGAEALAIITRKSCSDGMSDNTYPYTFSLEWEGGGGWHGCGRIKQNY